jgi:hypothetical protein
MRLKLHFGEVQMVHMVHIFALVINRTPPKSPFSHNLCQNVMFLNQNIDVNVKFMHSFIIFDHQVDVKTSHFGIK